MPEEVQERLQKFLAQAGIASRRKGEQLIQEGRVTVNGRIVTQLGTKVNPAVDEVSVDGQRVQVAGRHVYILLNKPRGVLSVMEDPRGHKALGDLIQVPQRIFPVGRLDATSEGLVFLTDDGELANLLTHPRYEHEKEYRVLVNGSPSDETLDTWRRGVVLEGQRTAPAEVEVARKDKDSTLLRVIMREGRKRQLRDVAALLGHPVRQLLRVRLGPLQLGTLKPGEWRHLSEREVEELTAVKRQAARGKEQGARGKGQEARGKEQEARGKGQGARGKEQEARGKKPGTEQKAATGKQPKPDGASRGSSKQEREERRKVPRAPSQPRGPATAERSRAPVGAGRGRAPESKRRVPADKRKK